MAGEGLDIVGIFNEIGGEPLFGSNTRKTTRYIEHGLQCAALARADGADDSTVLGALLHDLGRMVPPEVEQRETPDNHHGHWAAKMLGPFAPEKTTALVRDHVMAKRYLCTIDREYVRTLTAGSMRTLLYQGGLMSDEEKERVERLPWLEDALRLRHWDEQGKMHGLEVPPLAAYVPLLERYFGRQSEIVAHDLTSE